MNYNSDFLIEQILNTLLWTSTNNFLYLEFCFVIENRPNKLSFHLPIFFTKKCLLSGICWRLEGGKDNSCFLDCNAETIYNVDNDS